MTRLLPSSCGVVFSQTREDTTHETQLLDDLSAERRRPLNVLCIASAGDSALAMAAHPGTGRVDAVDVNPAQVHLVALKRAAALRLDAGQQLMFLGGLDATGAQRRQMFEEVAPGLDEAALRFWTMHMDSVAAGVLRIGVFERLLDELRSRLVAAGLDPLARPAQALGHSGWQHAFSEVFDRARVSDVLGAAAVGYAATRSFASHFSHQFASALRRFGGHQGESPVLEDALTATAAPVLAPAHLAAPAEELQLSTRKLHLHVGDVRTALTERAPAQGYDLIQLSSVTDLLPLREVHGVLKQASQTLAAGGAMLLRSINGKTVLADAIKSHLGYDAPTSAQMQRDDRAVFYREIAVGRMALA